MNKIDTNRVPPHSLDAETYVLGAALQSHEAACTVMQMLVRESFYKESNRIIYDSFCELENEGEPIDISTVNNQLERAGKTKAAGGPDYLAELVSIVPSAANIESYCKTVHDYYSLREIIKSSTKAIEESYKLDDPGEIIQGIESNLLDIAIGSRNTEFESIASILHETIKEIEQGDKGNVKSFLTKYDEKTGGLKGGEYILIAGRPGEGKTAFALNISYKHAINGKKNGFISLEMNKKSLVKRILSMAARIDGMKLRSGDLNDYDWSKLTNAVSSIANMGMFIDDSPGQSMIEIKSKARRLKMKEDIEFLTIDYAQLIRSKQHYQNRDAEITVISADIKNLAKELDIPIFVLCQMNRKIESGKFRFPVLSDLRESGSFEQDADFVQFIMRPERKLNMNGEPEFPEIKLNDVKYSTKDLAIILQVKARNATENVFIPFKFDAEYTLFSDFELYHKAAA